MRLQLPLLPLENSLVAMHIEICTKASAGATNIALPDEPFASDAD